MSHAEYQGWPVAERHEDKRGRPLCQSRLQQAPNKGWPCSNYAKFRIGPELACAPHVPQALDRNPGAEVKPFIRPERLDRPAYNPERGGDPRREARR